MKISVYKNSEEYLSREYDLSAASAKELENQLFLHCEAICVVPTAAGITIPREYDSSCDHVIKRTIETMSLIDAAIEILKFFHGRKKH